MADGTRKMSRGEFEVALGRLGEATRKVRGISGNIEGDLEQIRSRFASLPDVWRSPAEASSEPVMRWFDRASADLHALLEEMVRRMQVSYDTYLDAEKANFHNSGGGSGGSGGPNPKHKQYALSDRPPASLPAAPVQDGPVDPQPAGLRDRATGQGEPDA
ncbi:hypothetical protein C6Y14_12540 [Streptomyces dioscori]|uniref:WXG100 family type VII secretion target n=1 Tax=Streptomyces dioscori TaxID=2109333 RepID=A0A2P8Q9S7_9ACTN|nr:WXG100 family type VII secretion target [Streptomyces dioscori]PSM42997.1 hypothetical protein C6Y14_12540 [Streptomyces dioscori]